MKKISYLCVLCVSVVNLSFRQIFLQHRHDRPRERHQPLVRVRHLLVLVHRGHQAHQGAVGSLARERIPGNLKIISPPAALEDTEEHGG